MCLSQVGVQVIASLRGALDQHIDTALRQLIVLVDGSYTNKTVLSQLPPRTTLIGRIRKNAKLHEALPAANTNRRRLYGPLALTPEQVLKDESIPVQPVKAFIAGRVQNINVKTVTPRFWSKAGADKPLRLVVIKPLGYRLSAGSKLLYRDPAFLICTDVNLSIDALVQAYVYRWEIECNHRDEKSFIGVAEGHVRNPEAVRRLPQLQVASYSLLLLASLLSHGFGRTGDFLPLPKWRRTPSLRPSILDLLNLLRSQLFERAAASAISASDLPSSTTHVAKSSNFTITSSQLAAPSS
jgi:hypothetical protein